MVVSLEGDSLEGDADDSIEVDAADSLEVDDVGCGSWRKGIEGANFLWDIASRETGKSPVALKPDMKCSGFRDLSQRILMRPVG